MIQKFKNYSLSLWQKTGAAIKAHKFRSAFVALLILGGGYYTYGKVFASSTSAVKYTTGTVEKGTVISTVTATGQVAASNEVALTSKASGTLTSVSVTTGQRVRAGTLIASIDSSDDRFALQSAEIAYKKFLEPADSSDIDAAKDTIKKDYSDLWGTLSTVFTNFPTISSSVNDLYFTKTGFLAGAAGFSDRNSIAQNYIDTAMKSYNKALVKYQTVLREYNGLSANSDTSALDGLAKDTYDMTVLMAQAIKDAQVTITYIQTIQSDKNVAASVTAASSVNTLGSQVNGYVSSVLSAQNTISSAKKSLNDLLAAPNSLDLESEKLTLAQKQLAYANDFIHAPFDGIVAKIDVKKNDVVQNGTAIATLVTENKVASLSLNEVEAAKVKQGDKATLTFDAIDELSISGTVAAIDQIGTVSSGVVNYAVEITFDTNDDRIKSGMSVSAAIQTGTATEVLIVPTSAVKTLSGASYVQKLEADGSVTNIPVEVGLSDDTNIEIKSGLSENEEIITKTSSTAKTTTTGSAPSLFGNAAGRAGAGATRITR